MCRRQTSCSLNYYSSICGKEREENARLGKPRFSKLLVDVEDANSDDNDGDESRQSDIRLRHTVRELCKTIDAFIYVVDSSADCQRGNHCAIYCLYIFGSFKLT